MSFIEDIKNRARTNKKTIVLPEATDLRIIQATSTILEEDFANIILLGDQENIYKLAKENRH